MSALARGVLMSVLLLGANATTAQPDAVTIAHADCSPERIDEVAKLVALELSPRAVRRAGDGVSAATRAWVRCHDGRAELEVVDPTRAEPLTLSIDLEATPDNARTRLLALTLAELIATARLEASAPIATAEAEAEADAEVSEVSPPSERWLWVGVGGSRQGEPGLWSPAIHLGGALTLGAPFGLLLELQGHSGAGTPASDATRTTVHPRGLSATAGAAALLSLGGVELVLGAGAELGYAHLSGSSDDGGVEGRDLQGLWAGPALSAGVHLPVARPWALRLALDLDYVLVPVRGLDRDDSALYAVDGPRATLVLALALDVTRTRRAAR